MEVNLEIIVNALGVYKEAGVTSLVIVRHITKMKKGCNQQRNIPATSRASAERKSEGVRHKGM